jgi:hypothetical protein
LWNPTNTVTAAASSAAAAPAKADDHGYFSDYDSSDDSDSDWSTSSTREPSSWSVCPINTPSISERALNVSDVQPLFGPVGHSMQALLESPMPALPRRMLDGSAPSTPGGGGGNGSMSEFSPLAASDFLNASAERRAIAAATAAAAAASTSWQLPPPLQ